MNTAIIIVKNKERLNLTPKSLKQMKGFKDFYILTIVVNFFSFYMQYS